MAKLELEITDASGKKIGSAELPEAVFGVAPNIPVMHQVVRSQLAARRSGTHETKTRGRVSGGGRKPYRQKGTGRARQGTIRAPQWAGGGVVFGPHPRDYSFKVNRKEVKLAMRSALSAKRAEGALYVVDELEFESPSTKQAVALLKALELSGRVTLVLADNDVNAFLSFRNIPGLRVIAVSEANTHDFIDNKALIFTVAALKRIEEVLQ
jgi:large subunit ribosomal protein L4